MMELNFQRDEILMKQTDKLTDLFTELKKYL